MFDANDSAAEEGYEHHGREEEDDDGDYAEAQEGHGYSTPAGSFAGDYEDHAIGEVAAAQCALATQLMAAGMDGGHCVSSQSWCSHSKSADLP